MAKYTVQTWTDGVSSASAARLTVIENGIREASMGRSTTFPGSPVDGDIHVYPADAANGILWHFMYNTGSASAHKWEFIGGTSLYAEVDTDQGTASTTYVALATAGPSIAIPKAGDYLVEIGAETYNSGAGANFMSYDVGGTGAVDGDAAAASCSAAGIVVTLRRDDRRLGATAVTLTAKYRTTAGTANFRKRYMSLTPIRVTP